MTSSKTPRISFVELPARDLLTAKAFYAAAFGWTLTDFGPSYSCTMSGDVDLGLQGDIEEAPAAPLPVVAVDDLEATQAAVEQAITETGAAGPKDMGRVMAALKAKHAAKLDLGRATQLVKARLGS